MMNAQNLWPVILQVIPVFLAHLAGVVVAVLLLTRRGGTPAILALVGFAVSAVVDIPRIVFPLIQTRFFTMAPDTFRTVTTGMTVTGCCCSVLDVGAVVCLIIAIWQTMQAEGLPVVEEVEEGVE